MNKSEHINPIICRTCAKCCKWFSVGYDKRHLLESEGFNGQDKETNLNLFSELQRYLELQTDKIYIIEYEKEFSVIFDFPCENLRLKEGVYFCKTYTKSRPLLCEKYPYKLDSCEKFDKPLNVFRNSQDFLKRIKKLQEVD